MPYINSKATRIYVNADWAGTAPANVEPATLATAGWVFLGGARSDQAQSTPNTQDFYHYGEATAVSTSSPPSRTVTVPASEDLFDPGQMIARWAAENAETIGMLILKDGTNGYAVSATVVVNDESGDAQGGLRATGFTLTPLGQRVFVGESGLYEPA
jgi:hypothetical protein